MKYLFLLLFLCGCSASFKHVIKLPEITIIVSDDCSGHRGLAWPKSAEICVEGYLEEDGTITVTQKVLGHEVLHVLHHFDKKIRHPHGN